MKNILVAAAFLCLAAACNDDAKKRELDLKEKELALKEKELDLKKTETAVVPMTKTDLADKRANATSEPVRDDSPKITRENYYESGIVKQIYASGGKTIIGVDFIQIKEDNNGDDVNNLATHIVNENPKIRYFEIDSGTEILNCHNSTKITPQNIKSYEAMLKTVEIIVFEVKNGRVKTMNVECWN